jgi:putative membrane protein
VSVRLTPEAKLSLPTLVPTRSRDRCDWSESCSPRWPPAPPAVDSPVCRHGERTSIIQTHERKEGRKHMRVGHHLALVSGLLIAAVPLRPLHAQAKPADAKKDSIQVDGKFIREATADNLLEVRLGTLAQQKATNPLVKQFAERMVTDHQKLQDQWTDMASKHGMSFKPRLGTHHQAKLTRLEGTGPTGFDRAYMTAMIRNHMDGVNYFRNEGEATRSEPVRKLVSYELPILQEHLRAARDVGKQVGVDSAVVARSERIADGKK